jgi:agmatine deiminase
MMTPQSDGFRMPGEFEKHSNYWICLPHRPDNWRENAKFAQEAVCDLANIISEYEEVTMLVPGKYAYTVPKMLSPKVKIVSLDTDDAWVRDTGALFVTNGDEIRGVSFDFNAWGGVHGGLYPSWDLDSKVGEHMCVIQNMPMYKNRGFVLEGGSVHVDGEGTLITTIECLLSIGRNFTMSKYEIENVLKTNLNVQKIVWLPYGIIEDETNGHVDNICCFARPGEVILAWTDDENHPQYNRSRAAHNVLSREVDAKGRSFIIHKIHIPRDMHITQEESDGIVQGHTPRLPGDRLAASYVNFIMPNGAIVYPTFGDDTYDELAREKFEEIFPDRKIVGFYSRELLLGGGNIHCLSMQQPSIK